MTAFQKIENTRTLLASVLGGGVTTIWTFEWLFNFASSIVIGVCVSVISYVFIHALQRHYERHIKPGKKNKK